VSTSDGVRAVSVSPCAENKVDDCTWPLCLAVLSPPIMIEGRHVGRSHFHACQSCTMTPSSWCSQEQAASLQARPTATSCHTPMVSSRYAPQKCRKCVPRAEFDWWSRRIVSWFKWSNDSSCNVACGEAFSLRGQLQTLGSPAAPEWIS
jgi:hypothetical protein